MQESSYAASGSRRRGGESTSRFSFVKAAAATSWTGCCTRRRPTHSSPKTRSSITVPALLSRPAGPATGLSSRGLCSINALAEVGYVDPPGDAWVSALSPAAERWSVPPLWRSTTESACNPARGARIAATNSPSPSGPGAPARSPLPSRCRARSRPGSTPPPPRAPRRTCGTR